MRSVSQRRTTLGRAVALGGLTSRGSKPRLKSRGTSCAAADAAAWVSPVDARFASRISTDVGAIHLMIPSKSADGAFGRGGRLFERSLVPLSSLRLVSQPDDGSCVALAALAVLAQGGVGRRGVEEGHVPERLASPALGQLSFDAEAERQRRMGGASSASGRDDSRGSGFSLRARSAEPDGLTSSRGGRTCV